MGKVIAITNQKGGVGKTTTSINLASSLAEKGLRVLIVDIDAQGNATQGLGIDKIAIEQRQKTSYDLFLSDDDSENYVITTNFDNLYIIGSSQNLASFDMNYSGDMQKEKILREKLKPLKSKFDYIIIDCPPSLSMLTLNGITCADSVLIPVQSEFYALEGMTQLLNSIKLCKKHLNPRLKIEGIVLTMFMANTRLSFAVKSEVEKYFGKYVYQTVIRRNISLAEAPSHGMPINVYEPQSYGAKDYALLAQEVIANG